MRRSKGERRRGWRERWSEADAREFLGRWRESGKLLPAYCREQGIGYERVRRWHAKLERGSPSRERPIGLRPVRIVADPMETSAASATMEIQLRGDRAVRVDPGFDAEELGRLVGVLEQA